MRGALVLVCLAGCNQVFDLAPTHSVDGGGAADVDHDGIYDTADNCPTLLNPDQANADGDAFGDACDSCPLTASSSAHDEDRDRVGDDCDTCPGTPDFNVDGDSDGVGDLCDPLKALPNHRVAFEPFVTMPANWQADGVTWTQAGDSIGPDIPLGANDRLRNLAISTPATWALTAGVEARTRWAMGDTYGLFAENATDNLECSVTCLDDLDTATSCVAAMKRNGVAQLALGVVPQPSVTISIGTTAATGPYCRFGTEDTFSGSPFPADAMSLSIRASPRIRVSYVDYVE